MMISWTEKYRPTKLADFVFANEESAKQVNNWENKNNIPNILAHGLPGNGKTTLARMLGVVLKVDPIDIMVINASVDGNVDLYRDRIRPFMATLPLNSPFRIVHLEEADCMSPKLMAALRAPMEDHAHECKFILTANDLSKISKPIQSRCVILNFDDVKAEDIALRFEYILNCEGIDYDRADLLKIALECVPDIRKGILTLQGIYDTSC